MKLKLGKEQGVPVQKGMIGLFFEDINYAADGGLYAEMLENRSFEFMDGAGNARDYYLVYDGAYAWTPYAAEASALSEKAGTPGEHIKKSDISQVVTMLPVTGSPHNADNPHYMRVQTGAGGCGLKNKAYEGIFLKKGLDYHITFWARCVAFEGSFVVKVEKDGEIFAEATIAAAAGVEETCNFFRKYELTITAKEAVKGADFVLCMDSPGIVEFDYISMFPGDAVAGVFRKDLFEKLEALKPGLFRFPGGCVVEGSSLENRYRYKDSLRAPWARKHNWNRWAFHGNKEENGYKSVYSHYNQTLGLGYYEYFLLCELIGAEPLPVLSVGFACQYQSLEQVAIDSPEFEEYLQDAVDLIEFANGSVDTRWGAVRAQLGHEAPFHLKMIGIGNEQWQTERADFFERYVLFEQRIHEYAPDIRLIGSAGPDITSEKYTRAWAFYHEHVKEKDFVYAVDEHYYVKPQWLLEHSDFYDNYSRDIKVFAGEYAAHPSKGMNNPGANTLEGALAEAAFLTGVERNADVVVLASYAPLFARLGFTQWSPDMIWFDAEDSYGSPSYYVQQMYSANMPDVTLELYGQEKEAVKEGLYIAAGYCLSEQECGETIILKIINTNAEPKELELETQWQPVEMLATVLCGQEPERGNTIQEPDAIKPCEKALKPGAKIMLEANSFTVIRMKV